MVKEISECKVYQLEKDFTFATGKSTKIEGEKVPAGKVLRITHIMGDFGACKTSEYIELGYYNGHAYIPLKKAAPAIADTPVHWDGNVWLREEQFVYADMPDVANGELMKIRADGHWE